ncbi:high-affinity Fe2+/Pb2+ permease [Arthrobacter stackebrandtii]|uniref:High-affinity Fe2+/Pb2+ permease n=1 Tax=Arthrobacter stackebrandtii TaxID=272161 RepID=A0ABS4YW58_9MICC|nr:hypothetical protein [Arthrobacter stackebrandtii]MBP2412647.1 high-affinity Fe2+/Pb2+ permease [Arthrobacter stackebrandtii]
MGSVEPQNQDSAKSIKFPLGFSFAMGAVAGLVTLIVSAGGTRNGLRWDLGGIAFGIAFVASLLIASLLVMGHKENDPSLSEGSGINRRSADRLKQARQDSQARDGETGPSAGSGRDTDDGGAPTR